MKMEQTECSKTSAQKIQTPRNEPKERIQNSQHGGSLKSKVNNGLSVYITVYTLVKKTEPLTIAKIVKLYLQNFFKFKECNDLSKTIISKYSSKAITPAVWINGRVICENVTWPGQFSHRIFNRQSICNSIYCY